VRSGRFVIQHGSRTAQARSYTRPRRAITSAPFWGFCPVRRAPALDLFFLAEIRFLIFRFGGKSEASRARADA
jgi:hypothetical protein